MSLYFLGMILITAALSYFKMYWVNTTFIFSFMIIYNMLYTFACIGIFAIAMQCCWKKVSASQFTLYMTIANLGRIAMAALIGPIKANFNWQMALFAFAVMIILALVLLQFLNVNKQAQRVVDLEKNDAEKQMIMVN